MPGKTVDVARGADDHPGRVARIGGIDVGGSRRNLSLAFSHLMEPADKCPGISPCSVAPSGEGSSIVTEPIRQLLSIGVEGYLAMSASICLA